MDNRNKGIISDDLRGLSMNKEFRPSTSNIVGTDLSKYKLVYQNQFACDYMSVIRVHKLPVVLHKEDDPVIVSPAYTVFEVNDEKELNPEYLMMWFRRPEFDRYADFRCDSAIRGGFKWDELCETELPIPPIEKQREIVKEYKTITNRIALNEKLNQKLEETAQALYKHWFVDFEFPNDNGKPYKSSGGKMVYNEELDKEVPEGWQVKILMELCEKITKGTTPKNMSDEMSKDSPVFYFKGESIDESHIINVEKLSFIDKVTHDELSRSQLKENDICYSIAGSLDKFTLIDAEVLPGNTNQAIAIIRTNKDKMPYEYIYGYFIAGLQEEFYRLNVQQAVQANLSLTTIGSLPVLVPSAIILSRIKDFMKTWIERRNLAIMESRRLSKIKVLFLSKMTQIEVEETVL